jgi:DNA-binding GntR family transcriptional regulator
MAGEPASVEVRRPTRPEPRNHLTDLVVLVPAGVQVTSHADAAYYRIRDLVVTLELPPGEPVREQELMERLGLGRTPVREALHRLADDGLIKIWPRRGMVVAGVEPRDLADLTEVRLDLEGLAARLAAQRATTAQRTAAEELIASLAQVADTDDPRALIRLDQQVHRFVYAAAHNRMLAATLGEYLVLSLRLWFLGLDRVHRLDEAVREHRDLLGAVVAGDGETAERVAREHVRGFQREIGAVLAGHLA